MTKETFIYGLNACAVTYHNGQKFYEHDELVKCFEDLGIFEQDLKAVKVLKMREATPEERESIDKYIKSISRPTVTADNFWDLEQEPCGDMVSRGVFEQVVWERDVAIEQLKELGYGLGEKPRTGHWIMTGDYLTTAYSSIEYVKCSCCNGDSLEEGNYCPNCGAKMEESEG